MKNSFDNSARFRFKFLQKFIFNNILQLFNKLWIKSTEQQDTQRTALKGSSERVLKVEFGPVWDTKIKQVSFCLPEECPSSGTSGVAFEFNSVIICPEFAKVMA